MTNFKRTHVSIGAALLTVTFFVISVGLAQAPSIPLKVNIPFPFYTGETLLPAGEYEVRAVTNDVMRIFGAAPHASVLFRTIGLNHMTQEHANAKLVFKRYGEDYLLTEMWWTAESNGRQLLPSHIERDVARNVTPARVSVEAQ
jgi:hypothetical protein